VGFESVVSLSHVVVFRRLQAQSCGVALKWCSKIEFGWSLFLFGGL
jgi:hypothetical protein